MMPRKGDKFTIHHFYDIYYIIIISVTRGLHKGNIKCNIYSDKDMKRINATDWVFPYNEFKLGLETGIIEYLGKQIPDWKNRIGGD